MKMKPLLCATIVLLALTLLSGCDKKDGQQAPRKFHTVVAKVQKPVLPLHYTGAVEPISSHAVISPVDGRVAKINFEYGRNIEKGTVVVYLRSDNLADDFKKAVNDYLQKKDAYLTGKESFIGTEMLYKAGVTEKSAYLTERSSFEGKTLDYYQAIYNLQKILSRVNIDSKKVLDLTIADTTQVNELLRKQFSNIPVIAGESGIALFPIQDQTDQQGDDNDKKGKLTVGSEVKKGESILNVGDMSGLLMSFLVSEVDVNRIKVGMDATVTGTAFPEITLKGKVSSVSFQAQPDQSGGSGVSMFNVEVKVPHITAEQQKIIHVGMTGTVTINIVGKPSVMVPVAAVTQNNGQSYVTIEGVSGQKKQVRVTTGNTTLNDVVILQGVKAGDKVIVYDSD